MSRHPFKTTVIYSVEIVSYDTLLIRLSIDRYDADGYLTGFSGGNIAKYVKRENKWRLHEIFHKRYDKLADPLTEKDILLVRMTKRIYHLVR